MAHATTIAQNMTQMEIVWLHVLQDFINLRTHYAVYAVQIARNATAQLHARNVRQTFTLIWVIVWLLALQILLYLQITDALLVMFLVELVKTFQLNVSHVQMDTIMIQY
jgi:hypothetical protein